jgi:hypothetical protein
MRKILTFVVSLLVDDAEPASLRGTVRAVTDGECAFTNGRQLLEILRRAGRNDFAAFKPISRRETEENR